MARKVKIVSTVTALDSSGKIVDALPVREETGPTLNEVGQYVDPIEVEVDEDFGAPVRYVEGLVTTDSAGRIVPITPIAGVGAPAGFRLLTDRDGSALRDFDGALLWEPI
jgi:hypothetical protein